MALNKTTDTFSRQVSAENATFREVKDSKLLYFNPIIVSYRCLLINKVAGSTWNNWPRWSTKDFHLKFDLRRKIMFHAAVIKIN